MVFVSKCLCTISNVNIAFKRNSINIDNNDDNDCNNTNNNHFIIISLSGFNSARAVWKTC